MHQVLLVAVLLQQLPPPSSGLVCGYPGAPAFGRPHPLKELYNPGEFITYACVPGYSQQGPFQRTCLQNGTWSPTSMPLCDVSLSSVDQQATSRQTLSLYPANKSIDGDPLTCTFTDKLRPRWVRIDLRRNQRVKAVALTLPRPQDVAQFSVYAISVRDSTTASYHKCASFNGKFAATTLKVMCSGGEVEGRYIHVEDDRNRVDYFSLCEVAVYVHRDSYDCGEAERPAHAYSVITETGGVHYKCIHGYRLEGPDTRVCLTSHGQWSLHPPTCIEITCPPIGHVEHGQIYYLGTLTLGTIVNVTCDYGYQISGNAKICGQDGSWSEGKLSCRPIECGVPESAHLLNGTTEYGSVALHRCGHIIVCREDGTWSRAKCNNSSLSRLGLVNDEQNDIPTGIVVGMATVVFLLLLAVIFILLIKRKKVLRANTLPTSKELSAATTAQDNDVFYATIPFNQNTGNSIGESIMSTVLFTRNDKKGNRMCEEDPVYAQVDLNEKRRSRLKKSMFDEPTATRELPPIPDGNVTYASLSLPLDPPERAATSKNDFEISLKPR